MTTTTTTTCRRRRWCEYPFTLSVKLLRKTENSERARDEQWSQKIARREEWAPSIHSWGDYIQLRKRLSLPKSVQPATDRSWCHSIIFLRRNDADESCWGTTWITLIRFKLVPLRLVQISVKCVSLMVSASWTSIYIKTLIITPFLRCLSQAFS